MNNYKDIPGEHHVVRYRNAANVHNGGITAGAFALRNNNEPTLLMQTFTMIEKKIKNMISKKIALSIQDIFPAQETLHGKSSK